MNALYDAVVREATASDEAIQREYTSPFVIEDNVPPPRRLPQVYPFAKMKVNQSFFVPGVSRSNVYGAATTFAAQANNGWRFTTRLEKGGIRIWRIA